MQHDWKAFAESILTLVKTSGDSGDSGDKAEKSNVSESLAVPTRAHDVSPLENEWGQVDSASGDRKVIQFQKFSGDVPTVSTVPTQLWEDIFPKGIPAEWREGFSSSFSVQAAPDGYPEHRWRQAIDDGRSFLVRWGAEAANLGWTATDLFGASPVAPWPRVGMLGLVPLLNGDEVTALDENAATITAVSGSTLGYRKHTGRDGRACLWVIGGKP